MILPKMTNIFCLSLTLFLGLAFQVYADKNSSKISLNSETSDSQLKDHDKKANEDLQSTSRRKIITHLLRINNDEAGDSAERDYDSAVKAHDDLLKAIYSKNEDYKKEVKKDTDKIEKAIAIHSKNKKDREKSLTKIEGSKNESSFNSALKNHRKLLEKQLTKKTNLKTVNDNPD